MSAVVLLQATRGTVAAIQWLPVLVVACCVGAIAGLLAALSDRPSAFAMIGSAAIAATAVAAMRDRSDAVLAALPTSRLSRRLIRLALAAIVLAPVVGLVDRVAPATAGSWGPAVVLTLCGLAVATWLPPEYAVQAATLVPVVWVLAVVASDNGVVLLVAEAPWPIAAVAVVVVIAGRHR